MQLNETQIDYIETILTEVLDRDTHVYRDYSGRGMYGKTCPAVIVSDLGTALRLFAWLGSGYDDLAAHARMDDLGHDIIIYFPGVSIV